MGDKRKVLTRLDHKVWGQDPVLKRHRSQMERPRRRSQTSPVRVQRRNVVSPSCSRQGKRAVREAERRAGKRGWSKRRRLCHAAERDGIVLRESGLPSLWCLVTRKGAVHRP